uniref:Uncharacterized protein n=1 Tax=uncultured Methanosarcinales archaeon TaxID=183757 RepID=A0A7H1KNX3_9EURY|nr:hypothetical protein BFFPPMPJ_00042 [uncultured Methanosarcinales archaeon]
MFRPEEFLCEFDRLRLDLVDVFAALVKPVPDNALRIPVSKIACRKQPHPLACEVVACDHREGVAVPCMVCLCGTHDEIDIGIHCWCYVRPATI